MGNSALSSPKQVSDYRVKMGTQYRPLYPEGKIVTIDNMLYELYRLAYERKKIQEGEVQYKCTTVLATDGVKFYAVPQLVNYIFVHSQDFDTNLYLQNIYKKVLNVEPYHAFTMPPSFTPPPSSSSTPVPISSSDFLNEC